MNTRSENTKGLRQLLCCLLALFIVWPGVPVASAIQQNPPQAESVSSMAELVNRSYVDLFDHASEIQISKPVLERYRKELEREKEREEKRLEDEKSSIEDGIDHAQDELKHLNENPEETPAVAAKRHELHCRIQSLRQELQKVKLSLETGLGVTYDNKFAKLKILEEWPSTAQKLQESPNSEEVRNRKFSDFRDVGFRNGSFENQADDIKDGREAIDQLKQQGLLPPEVEDEEVMDYVRALANRLARHSDLQVPLHVFVLRSEEINAFALPGGFLFINSGLILKAEKESELAGVIAHEIAHVAARHGHRLMKRATIASIIFQAAQIAAIIFSGGIASIGAYYALQYGFYGLGLLLSLQLLGVSRDYEIEADILGTQYLWQSGYNTRGFVSFFDKMAQEKGYITGLSWFRTHPPFYKRMEQTFTEITIMPEQEQPIDDTSDFRAAKRKLGEIVEKMRDQDRDAPTLRRVYECEDQQAPAPSKEDS